MSKVEQYIAEAVQLEEYLMLKRSSEKLSAYMRARLPDGDRYVYIASDNIVTVEELEFIKSVLELSDNVVYIYNKHTEYTDLLDATHRTRYVEENNYYAFLLLSDIHIWFSDMDNFNKLVENGKLLLLGSPLDIAKNITKPFAERVESLVRDFPSEDICRIYGLPKEYVVKSGLDVISLYYANCFSKEQFDEMIADDSVGIDSILSTYSRAIKNSCYRKKVIELNRGNLEMVLVKQSPNASSRSVMFVKSFCNAINA